MVLSSKDIPDCSERNTMNKIELVNTVAFDLGLRKNESKKIVEKVFSLIVDSLIAGEDVTINNFCDLQSLKPSSKKVPSQ